MEVAFIEDDLTNLQDVNGAFDLLVDYGTLDDLRTSHRDLYMKNVLPLTRQGGLFLLFCFEWVPRWWERPFSDRVGVAMKPGEIERRFSEYFEIVVVSEIKIGSLLMPTFVTYLMTRKKQIKGDEAMIKIERSIVINRPIEEVFTYATESKNTAKWQSGLKESTLVSDGPLGAGSLGVCAPPHPYSSAR